MKPLQIAKQVLLLHPAILFTAVISAQTIGAFTTITPTIQSQNLVLPATHKFQRIIKSGDALTLGGTLGNNTDFTGYVPVSGSSRNGYLSISNETTPAGCAILGISFNYTSHTWNINSSGNVSFPFSDIGETSRFCSGTVTPNNTIIVCEEDVSGIDNNGDGYTDRGWLIEIDPATRTVINQDAAGGVDKLWAIGRSNHENAIIRSDNMVLYTGADDGSLGYLYKFIPATPGNFSIGTLYVLQTTTSLGNGTWRLVANTTQPDRNNIRTASTTAGAYNFNGIEDVEIGPDGKIYFAAKNEGKIYRFTDNGTFGTGSDISGLEVFAGNTNYPTITNYDIDGPGSLPLEPWGRGNDNLAFDGEGNLWVCQDAIVASDRNHIWVIGPTHTQALPQVRVFATTPVRCEPTGITFTPDYKFMFISFMGPSGSNTTSQLDAAGVNVVFNTHTTVVIARSENLGAFAVLPLSFTSFDVRNTDAGLIINWSVADINNHNYFSIERSANGIDFEEINRNNENINGTVERTFSFTDNNPPFSDVIFYRIRQCDLNSNCQYTAIKTIKFLNRNRIAGIYPQPAREKLTIQYNSFVEGSGSVTITDISGKNVKKETVYFNKGVQILEFNTANLGDGIYLITIIDKLNQKASELFMKK
jgi:secreted PhoX family phosphatase